MPIGALLAGLVLVLPSAGQVGGGKIVYAHIDGIYIVNTDGSGLAHVHGPCGGGAGCRNPVWSPDGSQFAFVDGNHLKVMAADGSAERSIYSTLDLYGLSLGGQAWSPDGQSIAFASSGALMVVTLEGSTRTIASGAPAPAWSPDGSRISFYRGGEHAYELLTIDPAGGVPTLVASAPRMTAPVWSADSRMLAFAGGLEGGGELYVVGADGTGLRQIAGGGTDSPEWAPDGTKIAFAKTVGYYDAYPYRDIHVVGVDGTGEERLTHALIASRASWAPDGKRILFSRNGAPTTMNADGACQSRLVADGALSSWELRWQPLPQGPPAGPKECHSLTVLATAAPTAHGASALITATLRNTGTKPLTRVRFVPPRSSDLTVRTIGTSRGRCSLTRDLMRCEIGRLAPGQEARILIRADGRRVSDGGVDGGALLETALTARAAEPSIEPGSTTFAFRIFLPRCTTRTPGGGVIVGSDDPERICGRRGPDRIDGKGGRNRIRAGSGNDSVYSRSQQRDVISCGRGRDSVVADLVDVVARDCERISRR